MKRITLTLVVMALVPVVAFAIDGQVLINQSTVMAAGGFHFVLSQPGSYKLSGNLIAPVNTAAIQINASAVTLDLNGFAVQCSVQSGQNSSCIFGSSIHEVAVRNGVVMGSLVPGGSGGLYSLSGVGMSAASRVILEDLRVELSDDLNNFFPGGPVNVGANSITRRTTFSTNFTAPIFACPALIIENVNATPGIPILFSTCVRINNVNLP
jgi:hypothetical protein